MGATGPRSRPVEHTKPTRRLAMFGLGSSRWRRKDSEIDEELRSHLALATLDRVEAGRAPDAAHRAAKRELGHVPLIKEEIRAVWGWPWLEGFVKDVALATRSLRREPAFLAAAIFVLALGIGASTAIFSLVNAVLIRPLAVPQGDRVVRIVQVTPNGWMSQTSLPLAGIFLQQTGVFHDVAAHRLDMINLTGVPHPEQIPVARVAGKFFRLF